eukprot:10200550-Alexandrium_andersonii.AAC.1
MLRSLLLDTPPHSTKCPSEMTFPRAADDSISAHLATPRVAGAEHAQPGLELEAQDLVAGQRPVVQHQRAL